MSRKARHKRRSRRPFTKDEMASRKLNRLLRLPTAWLRALARVGQL